jgi:hypothetical protein
MASMLYIGVMTTKLNHPDDIGFSSKAFGRDGLKAGAGWMFLVFVTDIPGLSLLKHHLDWPLLIRFTVVMVPLVCGIQYMRGVARWIRGMDEFHRPLAVESFIFATTIYLFLAAAWFLFGKAGVWAAVAQSTAVNLENVPWSNCTFIICMTYILFGAGYSIIKRRYQ